MPHDVRLAKRIDALWQGRPGATTQAMFGGVVYQLNGHICLGIWETSLIARIGPQAYAAALQEPGVGEFNVTGRPMRGWVLVRGVEVETDHELRDWVERAVKFVRTLPPKLPGNAPSKVSKTNGAVRKRASSQAPPRKKTT